MNAHLITGEKNNEPRIGVCDMFSTNIVSVNNFYKRFASVYGDHLTFLNVYHAYR